MAIGRVGWCSRSKPAGSFITWSVFLVGTMLDIAAGRRRQATSRAPEAATTAKCSARTAARPFLDRVRIRDLYLDPTHASHSSLRSSRRHRRLIGCSLTRAIVRPTSGVAVPTTMEVSQSRKNALTSDRGVSVGRHRADRSAAPAAGDPSTVFGGGRSQPHTKPGLGTGFVIRKDGVIVTNARGARRRESPS